MALGLVGMLCLGAARAVAAARQPENRITCAVLCGGDAMGQWVGRRRRARGQRVPGAHPAGVGVRPRRCARALASSCRGAGALSPAWACRRICCTRAWPRAMAEQGPKGLLLVPPGSPCHPARRARTDERRSGSPLAGLCLPSASSQSQQNGSGHPHGVVPDQSQSQQNGAGHPLRGCASPLAGLCLPSASSQSQQNEAGHPPRGCA